MSKTGAVLSLFKSKNKLEYVIMGIMIICLGAYLSISYAGTVYPQMDATVFPSPALMYFYKVHEIGQNFWIFICILVILPNLESSKYLDRRVSGFNHFMIQRIGKRKTCLLSFGKNIVKSFLFVLFLEIFLLLVIHFTCGPINFIHMEMVETGYFYAPQGFVSNEFLNLLIYLLSVSFAYAVLSSFIFAIQLFIKNKYVYYASGLIVGIVLYIGPVMLQHILPQVPILENLFHALCISNIIELGITVQSNGVSILSYLVTILIYSGLTLILVRSLERR